MACSWSLDEATAAVARNMPAAIPDYVGQLSELRLPQCG